MSKKTIETFYSDLSGDEIGVEANTATLGFDGVTYSVDLTDQERLELNELFRPYVEVARKAAGRRSGTRASSPTSARDSKAIRAWATENNVDVPARGRLPLAVLEAYDAAQ